MIPLIAAGGVVSLADDVAQAWKAHEANVAATRELKVAKAGPAASDFQTALTNATTKAVAAVRAQQQAALPANLRGVAGEILQQPQVASMTRASSTRGLTLEFNGNGDLYSVQGNGTPRAVNVTPDIRQQLQQLNETMRHPVSGGVMGPATVTAGTSQVTLEAV